MSEKKVSVRVGGDTARRLDREDVNTSGLIRSLLDGYFMTGDTVEAGLQKQLADLEDELKTLEIEKTQLEQQIAKKEREIEQVEHRLKQRRENVPDEVAEFAEKIENGTFPMAELEPDNPAVQNYATKSGLGDPERFIQKVRDTL
jgi:septal ring factor EnvC (AmiA/AmiB activator)